MAPTRSLARWHPMEQHWQWTALHYSPLPSPVQVMAPSYQLFEQNYPCSIVVLLHILNTIHTTFSVTSGSVQLYNDFSKALKYINSPGRKFKRFSVDAYDLLYEIQVLVANLHQCIFTSLLWVKGHYSGWKRELQHNLNAEANYQATTFLKGTIFPCVDISPPSDLVSLQKICILTSKWQKMIRSVIHAQPLCNAICKNASWTTQQFNMVDWCVLEACLTHLYQESNIPPTANWYTGFWTQMLRTIDSMGNQTSALPVPYSLKPWSTFSIVSTQIWSTSRRLSMTPFWPHLRRCTLLRPGWTV
jgi:hypothetical protein